MCGGPPGSQTKITERSSGVAAVAASACSRKKSLKAQPAKAVVPSCSAMRRVIGPEQRRGASGMAGSQGRQAIR